MRAGQYVLVVALLLATLCSCASNPARQEQPTALDAPALRTRLIEGQWMLFSWAFPVMPTEGYPIEFAADGHVQTRNLGLIELWWLTDDDLTLNLASSPQQPSMTLTYDSQAGVFVLQPVTGPAFVIGPHGFDFAEYLNNLQPPGGHATR